MISEISHIRIEEFDLKIQEFDNLTIIVVRLKNISSLTGLSMIFIYLSINILSLTGLSQRNRIFIELKATPDQFKSHRDDKYQAL